MDIRSYAFTAKKPGRQLALELPILPQLTLAAWSTLEHKAHTSEVPAALLFTVNQPLWQTAREFPAPAQVTEDAFPTAVHRAQLSEFVSGDGAGRR